MIEKWMSNELSVKRWRRFKSRKSAVVSCFILGIMLFGTATSNFWANSKPIYLNYKGETFFPALIDYHPDDFNITDSLEIEYKKLELAKGDSALWPIVRWDPFENNPDVDEYPSPPTSENIMGTDEAGRDVFSRLLYGFYYSIAYAIFVWVLSTIIAIITGGMMGYIGGRFDLVMQRLVEVFSTVPVFFLLLILISIYDPNLTWLVIISTIFGWIGPSYYVRGEFLKNRKREFVEAAISMGASRKRVIFKHILPNSLTPLITYAPFVISGNIVALASLDYLGFGLQVPTPSWGELLQQAQNNFTIAWWLAVYPSLALFVTLTVLNLIGEGVRDAMDPNLN